MAGDWIKMRVDIGDDPAVVLMAAACDLTEDEVVGKLHRLWCWADRHTTDGTAPAITAKWVDRYVGCTGFAEAMKRATWLDFTEAGVLFPHFDRHNGESAKRRAENTIRQRLSRANRDAGMTGVTRAAIPRPFVRHVMKRDDYTCVFCGVKSDAKTEGSRRAILSVDHLTPGSRGGSAAVENLACACRACNNEKNDRTPEEWGCLPTFLQPGVAYRGGILVGDLSQVSRDKTETREEKRREEKKEQKQAPVGDLLAGVSPQLAADFKALRGKLKAPITETAIAGIRREAEKAGLTFEEALTMCCERGWRGFKAEWVGPKQAAGEPQLLPRLHA